MTRPGSTRRRRSPARVPSRRLRRLGADAAGSAAVEFAMLAFPFFAVLAVVFQAGLHILAQQSLDDAVDRVSRALFTGTFQADADGTPAADRMRSMMCESLQFVRCADLKLDVTSAASFAAAPPAQPYDAKAQTWNSAFGKTFTCPAGDSIVSITAAVPIPVYFSLVLRSGQAMPGGKQLLVSTAIFRAEPYPAGAC
jgi:Flp pilus assembly protein TadG